MSEPAQQFGEFAILEKLGQGAMGAVYKARQTSLNRVVALKLLPAHYAGDADFLARFKNEAMAAAALNHPHIVQVYAAGEDRGTHFFAMEYVEGESFGARMERKGRLDPREVIAVACHVAQALEYAWRKAKVIHRDIKPDNIFLSREGTVKLGDLGLAKLLGNQGAVTQSGAAMGTPYYVSPEQAMGTKEIDFRADIYSLGCTIYHAITGLPPYRGESAMAVMLQHVSQPPPRIQEAWPACPPPLIGLLDRMLRKRPAERHESYAVLLEQLFWVAERIDQPAIAEDAANSLVVPKAVPRPPTTPDASRKSAPAAKGTKAKAAPPARGRGKMLAILGIIAVTGIVLPVWQPWKKQTPATSSGAATTEKPASPAPATAVPTANIIPSDATKDAPSSATTPPTETPAANSASISPPPSAATKDAPFVNSLGMKFVPVPITGGPTAGQRVLFGVWDVRVQDYAVYAGAKRADDSWTKQQRGGVPAGREPNHPVVGVSWEDAQAFCQWLTEKESAEGKLPNGLKYRLPSDEEWSWAVGLAGETGTTPAEKRGKNALDFPWGKEWPPIKKVGNYADETYHGKLPKADFVNFDKTRDRPWIKGYDDGYATTSPVGSFPANAYGLYDMGGNVWQWCEDWYDASHMARVARGASWVNEGRDILLSSDRADVSPGWRMEVFGFRCVLAPALAPTPTVQPSPPVPAPTPTPTAGKSDTVPDAEGYRWLLAGNPFRAWKQVGDGGFILQDDVATSWVPQNGDGCWWYSRETFADFTLKLEFRISTPGGNSGVYVRLPDPSGNVNAVRDCYQIDISDWKNPLEQTGAICLVKPPMSVPQKAGEWNEMEINAVGQRYQVRVNGTQVNDFTGSKELSGYIGLQDFKTGGVQFRNIRIKESTWQPVQKPKSETEKWLAQMDAIYLPMYQREVTAPYETGMAALKKNYVASLDRENTSASRALKLKEAIALRNERQRFEAEGSVPNDDSIPRTSVLGTLRAAYLAQAARLETDRRKHAATIFAQYDKVLEANQNALTQRQRLDEALQLHERREALSKDWGVASNMGAHAGVTVSQPFVNTLGMKFVPVPGTQALFSVWDTRVQDYAAYARENTGINMEWKSAESNGESQGPTHPVVNVSWSDAKAFCEWLTRKERAAGKIAATETYRLPTDHEWSCAVGLQENPQALPSVKDAQIKGVYPWGTAWPLPKNAGNYFSTHEYKFTSPVGNFPANRYGLHDMGGNVWQWCEDWYDPKQLGRVLRGGSWNTFDPVNLLASYRTLINPAYRGGSYGFRCVLDFGVQAK